MKVLQNTTTVVTEVHHAFFSLYSSSSFALFSDPQEIDLSPLPFNRTLVAPFFITNLFISIITDLQVRFHLIKAFHVASPTWHNHIAERLQTQGEHFSCRWEWIFINKFVGLALQGCYYPKDRRL